MRYFLETLNKFFWQYFSSIFISFLAAADERLIIAVNELSDNVKKLAQEIKKETLTNQNSSKPMQCYEFLSKIISSFISEGELLLIRVLHGRS